MIENLGHFEKNVCSKPKRTPKANGGYEGQSLISKKNNIDSLEKRIKLYIDTWEQVSEGQRNATAYLHACQLREFNLSDTETFEILADWNSRNNPPLPESEIRKAVSNAENYAKRPAGAKLNESFTPRSSTAKSSPDTWEKIIPFSEIDLPKFPVEVLPEKLGNYVTQISESLQIPVDMPAMLSLAACSYCVSGCEVSPKPDWTEPLNIFTAIIMPPASKKSAAMKYATEPLKAYEKKRIEDVKQDVIKNQSERRVLENKQKKLEAKLSKGDNVNTRIELNELNQQLAEFEEIFSPTIIASDSTPEAVTGLLSKNDGKLGIFNAEGGIFGTMAGRYNSGTPNLDVFLQGHAGDSLKVNRIGRPTEYIEHPRLTIGLAIQPTILENLKHKLFMKECGLLARFLFVTPDSDHGSGTFKTKPIRQEAKAYYENLISGLLKINDQKLTLESDAEKSFAAYYEAIEQRLNGDLYQIQAWAGKLRGAVLRIAGILELVKSPDAQTVSQNTIFASIAIGEYLTKHAKAVFDLMDFDQELHLVSRILNWMGRKNEAEFSLMEVYQGQKTTAANKIEDFKKALQRLIEHNYLHHFEEKTEGRPANKFRVNPEFFKSK